MKMKAVIQPFQHKKVIRNRGRKWDEKEKWEGVAVKMTEKFEDIMSKKQPCVKGHEMKELKTEKRFSKFMEMQY